MKILYQKRFLKELAKIPSKQRTQIEEFVFEKINSISSIQESNKIEKMKSYSGYYKIRFGQYRVGLKYKNNEITF